MSDLPEFVLDRVFDAPVELVWKAWTDPELLAQWYGPNVETVIHRFELVPEGVWLNEMKMERGSSFQKVVFKEVVESQKLVWHHFSSVDSDWNPVTNPMMPDWPALLLTTVTFEQTDGEARTSVRLSQVPMDATAAEISCFAEMKDNMGGGWGAGYAIIDQLLQGMRA